MINTSTYTQDLSADNTWTIEPSSLHVCFTVRVTALYTCILSIAHLTGTTLTERGDERGRPIRFQGDRIGFDGGT